MPAARRDSNARRQQSTAVRSAPLPEVPRHFQYQTYQPAATSVASNGSTSSRSYLDDERPHFVRADPQTIADLRALVPLEPLLFLTPMVSWPFTFVHLQN